MNRPLTSEEIKERFKYQIDLKVDESSKGVMYWINHIGDKCVTVENKSGVKEDEQKNSLFMNYYTFRLYNVDFIEIGCFTYLNEFIDQDAFNSGSCSFSPDGHYFGMVFNRHYLGFAYFPHGFEYDLFVEQSYGQTAFDQMFKESKQYVHMKQQIVLDVACSDEEYLKKKDQDNSEEQDNEESEEEDQKNKNKKKIAQKPQKGNPEIILDDDFVKMRISKTYHIYLFRETKVKDKNNSEYESMRFTVYKSNKTVDQFIAAIDPLPIEVIPGDHYEHAYKRIDMLQHFSKVKTLANKLDKMYVRSPIVIGIGKPGIEIENEREYKIEYVYDYEEEKIVKIDLNETLDKKEMNQLSQDVIFQPSMGKGCLKWYFIAFGFEKVHIFKRMQDQQTKEISLLYRFSLDYPEDQISEDDIPIKVISMQTLIFKNDKTVKYFKIQEEYDEYTCGVSKSLEFQREIPCPKGRGNALYFEELMIQMHQSSLFFLNMHQVCNLSREPIEYYTSRILIPEEIKFEKQFDPSYSFEQNAYEQIIGINCFEEVLSEWDLRIYMGNKYQSFVKTHLTDQSKDLKFYSKRLNLAIFSDSKDSGKKEINHKLIIIDLRGISQPIIIDKVMRIPFIRTFEDAGKEILRVLIASEASNAITCHTFTYSIETVIEATFTPISPMHKFTKLYISQNGQEVTIFQGKITVIQLQSSNHREFVTKTTELEIFDPDFECLFWENRIMLMRSKIIRVADDYTKVEAETNIKSQVDAYKHNFAFKIGELYFGLFCIEHDNGPMYLRRNFQGVVFVYEIATMMLKTQIIDIEIDVCFSDYFQERLQSFTSLQSDGGTFFFKTNEHTRSHQQYILRLKLYNQELDALCGIPLKILIRPNLISVVGMDSGLLAYYPMNTENKREAFSVLATSKLRFHFNDMLDFIDINPYQSLLDKEKEVLSNIQKANLYDLTSYNVIHRSFYFCTLQRNPLFKRFIQHVLRRLEYLQSQESMPYLLFEDAEEINPLVEALNNQNGILAQNILQLCISSDEAGLLYAQSINIRLQSLIKMGLDLKPYLSSNLPYHIVEEQYNYGTYDTDPTYRIIASNKKTLIETLLNKETIDSQKEGLQKKISSFLLNPEKEVQKYRIAYNVVNMKDLIGGEENDPTLSIKVINDLSQNDISYYEIEVLQAIVKFKWQTYTRKYFLWQFGLLLVFLVVYITDLIFGSKTFGLSQNIQWKGFVATRVICQVILIYFLQFEVIQLYRIGFLEYFSSVWNINDVLLQSTYTTYLILSLVAPTQLYAIKSLQSAIIYLTFIKVGFYMRIFSDLSFLVQMLLNVFYDLRFFLFFFGVVIGSFALYLGILVNELTDYEGIGVFGYFGIALRTSLGDYDFDSFVKNSDYDILTWIVWFLIMIVGNVVFMNFIIAVVSQSYENCMQSMAAQSYKVKVDLIMERESLMTQADLEKRDWFPNFIIVRKPLLDGVDASHGGESYGEWQGLLREMQKGVKRQNETIREEMKKNNIKIENQISKVNTDIIEIKEMLEKMAKQQIEASTKKPQTDVQNKKK